MVPEFQSLEYLARDPDNLTILRACSGRWVRNKDIARATGMTPAGAKRRNDLLEAVGLLERRRKGKEVQYCATLLSYVANLDLAEEARAASMGVIHHYLELTRPYSERLLQDLHVGGKVGNAQEGADSGGEIQEAFEDGKAFFGLIAYLWPSETLAQIRIDLPGFERTGTRILTVNDIVLPIPRLRETEYDKAIGARWDRQGGVRGGERVQNPKEALLRSLITGHARVVDYSEQETMVRRTLTVSGRQAEEYLSALSKLKDSLAAWKTKGPLLVVITQTLDRVMGGLRRMGVSQGREPEPAPVGMPKFPILEPFSEGRYVEIKKQFAQ